MNTTSRVSISKRILMFLLSLAMIFTLMPLTSLASYADEATAITSAEEFAATMKNLEPWHNYKQKENAGQEQAVKKEAEKAPKAAT